ncbi:uncharacterized protein LACBIDRAFT_311441 [Laccaria bicolor S238N-H82]|uniref:Predicted protein n=1 Tax=Laccaria bicolor (strain S238N-H82 / ATCC MYA-4686) TaxID=486041 RepID=B0CXD7_LACBS|nr:uncharacterized protein LACBIDRAFT_311441 [Laccaria bicolor S238N-H82]EDR12707.1 predicted protein [Laccaria bicolor S238N-H82]|eukprot:XP_001876971.1 predicted protein [Laccaria bicolor S238N-H82]
MTRYCAVFECFPPWNSNNLDSRYVAAYKSSTQTTRKLQVRMSCKCERVATTCPSVQGGP